MSLPSQKATDSADHASLPDAPHLASQQTLCTRRWWHRSRLPGHLEAATQFGLRAAFFILVGAIATLLVVARIRTDSANVRPSGIAPGIVAGHSPGVQFRS